MTFRPAITARLEGIAAVDALRWRVWDGAIADVWHAETLAGARGEYVSPYPRLFVLLDKEGGDIDLRLSPKGPDLPACRAAQQLSFVPAGVPLWSRTDSPMRLRHLDIHIDTDALSRRVGARLDPARLATPRLTFVDQRLLALAQLIAEECTGAGDHHDLYGDALTLALLIDLLGIGEARPRRRTALAGWQLQRAIAFIEANCLRAVRLQELADLAGLSQSHFSHAFKASTGLPPHRWHMKARIRKVQEMLVADDRPLTAIATRAGFADQAHFTRVFHRIVGTTPAAWRRARRGPSG